MSDLELHWPGFARNGNGYGGWCPVIAAFGFLSCAIDPDGAIAALFLHDAVDDDVIAASAVPAVVAAGFLEFQLLALLRGEEQAPEFAGLCDGKRAAQGQQQAR